MSPKTADYSIASSDNGTEFYFQSVPCSALLTATLPSTAPAPPWMVTIIYSGCSALEISPNSRTLNGTSSAISIAPNQSIFVWSDGANYEYGTGPAGAAGTNGTNGTNGADGPTGNDGATGATGPTGPAASPTIYSFTNTANGAGLAIACPAGHAVLGGGGTATGATSLSSNTPVSGASTSGNSGNTARTLPAGVSESTTANGWGIAVADNNQAAGTLNVYVICS